VLRWTYINGELSAYPYQLRDICLNLPDTTDMRLECVDRSCTKLVYGFKVFRKHVRMLVILGGYVLLDRVRQRHIYCSPEGEK